MHLNSLLRLTLVAATAVGSTTLVHAQAGPCSDAAINRSFTTLILRPAHGSGNTGECNPALYGVHKDQHTLDLAVVAYVNSHASAPAPVAAASDIQVNLSSNTVRDSSGSLPLSAVTIQDESGHILSPAQAAALVAAGGGNLVAAGGGNLVAAGGGNFHLQSAGQKKVLVLKKR